MSVRDGGAQPLASRSPAVEAGHLGGSARLVDKDHPLWIKRKRSAATLVWLASTVRRRVTSSRV